MYGCEAWVMTEKTKQQLERWERKILRKIYGPIKDKNGWRIRTNSELTQLYKKPNIITLIKAKSIEWIGHVSRMDDGRSIKKIFEEDEAHLQTAKASTADVRRFRYLRKTQQV
ncbi:hypothetical protein C0J52_06603 [Blattella germanica]|nr:hypothetical protein C0J52_06603 [Blattella germanica]